MKTRWAQAIYPPDSGAISGIYLRARGTQFITILYGFSSHQEVFLRLTRDYQWDSWGLTTKDILDSLPVLVLDTCIALGRFLTRQYTLWPTAPAISDWIPHCEWSYLTTTIGVSHMALNHPHLSPTVFMRKFVFLIRALFILQYLLCHCQHFQKPHW